MKIKTRLILLIPAIFLALALLTVISYLNSQRQAANLVEAQAQNIALEQSALIFNNLRQAEEAVVFLTSTLLEMRAAGLTDRESLNHLVKSYAASSKNFFGVWAIFEPNAYDGKDAEFVDNEALGNSEGRANAYWLQKDGGLGYDLSDDYDQEPYYILPQQKGGLIIIPPYRDMDTENKTLMSSIVMPIIESGRFLGAVGIDIEMDFIQNLIESIKPYETGYAMLVSDAGSIIAQPDSAEISENLPQVSAEILQQIRQGEPFSIRDESIQDKSLMECFYIPVKLSSFESPWYFMVALPHDKVMAEANRSLYLQLAIGIIVLIALLVLVFYTANGVSSPLRRIVGYAQAVAAGNFNSSIDVKSKDEVGSMVNALRSMVTQLKERLGFTQGIMHGIVTPFAVVDIQGRMTYLNPQLIAYWGLKGEPEKYFGKTSGEFFYGNADDKTPLDKVLMDKSLIQNMPISSINAEGHKKYMSMTAAPLWDLDGNLLGACMLITDETEVREQQVRILSLNERITMSVKEAHSISGQQAEAFKRLDSQLDKTSAAALNQNAASEQTMESVAAMSRTLEMLAQKALKTTEDTKDTRREAEDGKRIVNETVDCIHKVAEYARRAAQGMEALGKQADGITHIVELIRDIADQTNLLALNAAIEAARAGDAGRGFAVVADEVRKLAEKTTQATNDVQTSVSALQGGVRQSMGLIDETVQLAGTSTQLAQQSGESLNRIVNIADNAVEEVSAIAQATGEESRTSTQMVGSMTEISAMARQSAENMKDSMDAVSRLAMFSEQLKNLIESMGSDRRKADRCQLDSPYFVTIEGTGIRSVSCRVLDISVTGVRLEVQKGVRTEGWQKVTIRLHADRPPLNTLLNSASGEIVWQDGILCGVEFDKPLSTTFEQLNLLIAKVQKGLF